MVEEVKPQTPPVAESPAPVAESPAPVAESSAPVEVEKEVMEVKVSDPQPEEEEEEVTKVADEPVDPVKKALDELKQLLAAAVANKEFTKKKKKPKKLEKPEEPKKEPEEKMPEEETKEAEEPKKEPEEEETEKKEKEVEATTEPPEAAEVTKGKEVKEDEEEVVKVEVEVEEEEVEAVLWGFNLLDGSEESDTVLLKFLQARDLKVKDAMAMVEATVVWRKEFGADGLLKEDLQLPELEKAIFMHGKDREGHPVCYNVYGSFEDKGVFEKAFGSEEKRRLFLRWRVQLLEKGIKELLDFRSGGVSSMVQVNDLKGSPWLWRKEIRSATRHALDQLQNNYPEFVAHQICINVPWWHLAYNRMMSPFINSRSRSKFVFAGPSRSADVLFKYVAPEQVPVQYGGLSKDDDPDFLQTDAVTVVTIRPSSKQVVEIPVSEIGVLVWEFRVLGWEVSYGAEFVPDAEESYTVIVQKSRRVAPADDPVEKNSFKIGEKGKILLLLENCTSRKKKLLYRYKIKSSQDSSL